MAQKLSNLPIGAKIKFGKHQVASETELPIIWIVADKNHSGYPSDSVTLVAEKIIDVRQYDAAERTYVYGYNNYERSNINQWLNSSASAGTWYSATHSEDAPPDYQSRPGFLYYFQEFERNALLPTTITVQTDSDVSRKISPKVFLLSEWELRGSGNLADGSSELAYFASNTASSTVTQQVFSYASNKPSSISTKYPYWTRSTYEGDCIIIGTGSNKDEYNAKAVTAGVRPGINLSANTKISDGTDADGCYTAMANAVPTISGANTNLGTIDTDLEDAVLGFKHTYSVNDTDSIDSVTVTEYIDNTSVRSYVATKNATNALDVTGNTWLKLTNGTHTLKITATDGFATVTRTVTFVKSVNKIVVTRSTPIAASERPSQIIVSVIKHIPEEARMTVEVCNNGFDAAPVWDELDASSISSGLAHTFSNGKDGKPYVCTAGKWGVNIRVTVKRNGGEGACYISEIGGNFE